MAREIGRGQIWQLRIAGDKKRPVLVLSRQVLIDALHTVTVAAITSTGRGSPTEVEVTVAEGLKGTSFVNLVNVFTVPKRALSRFVGSVDASKMKAVCQSLAIAVGCES